MATTICHTSLVSIVVGLLFVSLGTPHARDEAVSQTREPAESFRSFIEAVDRHRALHAQLRAEVRGPVAQSSAAQVSAASDLLAAAIRRARPRARQGDFFDADTVAIIRHRLGDELRSKSTVRMASIDDEQIPFRHPRIYARFPAGAEMATMPPTLLRLLPTLPDELEYRIVGEYLVLRDVKAGLVLDYIPRAIPAHSRRTP